MKSLMITMILLIGFAGVGCKKKATSKDGPGSTSVRYIQPSSQPLPHGPVTTPTTGGANDPYVFYIDNAANVAFETPDIKTDNILDVVFVPSYNATGNIHAYTHLGVKVCVNGRCDVSQPSRIGQASHVFKFQDRVANGKARIKISDPVYDFYCKQYGLACPFKSMYDPRSKTDFSRVRWAGRLIIATNDTKRIEDALYNRYDEQEYNNRCYGGYIGYGCIPGYTGYGAAYGN